MFGDTYINYTNIVFPQDTITFNTGDYTMLRVMQIVNDATSPIPALFLVMYLAKK